VNGFVLQFATSAAVDDAEEKGDLFYWFDSLYYAGTLLFRELFAGECALPDRRRATSGANWTILKNQTFQTRIKTEPLYESGSRYIREFDFAW
jgi:hypothetical protein